MNRIFKFISIISLIIGSFFIFNERPMAQDSDFYLDNFKVGGYTFSSSKFNTLPTGNFRFSFDLVPFNFQAEQKLYVSIVVCSDFDFEGGYGDTGISNISISNTNKSCKYPNSSYSKGRIKIINFNLVTNVGNEFSGGLSVYSPAQFSITLINFNLSASNFVGVNDLPTDIDLTDTNVKIDDTNKKIDDTNKFLKDDTAPNSDISALGNVQGLLPPGPVDTLLNIPFTFLSIVSSSLSGTCVPLTGDFVFGSSLTIPCFGNLFYDNVPSALMVFINLIPSAFILINYFKHLYKKVDRAVSLQTTAEDEWGVI